MKSEFDQWLAATKATFDSINTPIAGLPPAELADRLVLAHALERQLNAVTLELARQVDALSARQPHGVG
jgi:hypothetical protein